MRLFLLALGLVGLVTAAGARAAELNVSPGGLVMPAHPTPVGVAAGEVTFDFRTGKPGQLALWPQVTVRYRLDNPTGRDQEVEIGAAYVPGMQPPYPEGTFTLTWRGQEQQARVGTLEPALPTGAPLDLATPLEHRWLNLATGQPYAVVHPPGRPEQVTLFRITVPAGGQEELTLRFRQSYSACDGCSGREPTWHWLYLLQPNRGWAFVGPTTIRAVTPAEATLAAQPALMPAGSEGGAPVYATRLDALPPGDLHITTLLHRPPRVLEEWPWWLGAGLVAGAVLYLQYRSAARRA